MKEDRKESILETAERLFSENGYDGTSTRAIASEAGVNMAMLNYYFGSKEGLYKAVFERKFKGFHQTLTMLNEENISSWDKLKKYVELYVDRVSAQSCFQRLMQHELSLQQRSGMESFIVAYMLQNINEIRRILKDGIENGSFRDVDIDLTISTLFGTKYYLINLPSLASVMLGKDLTDPEVLNSDIKPRLKKHLYGLLESYLKK
ncbi:TetR/AcrR family transcriptional regulator [Arcticibacter sp. MXS-1]|uniref:TetR/AcrR family transcriptional regulator n=1 Tax=Arcticibacter sp. MXS-1 TaxID=3341726 RepID=UPI0035A8F188